MARRTAFLAVVTALILAACSPASRPAASGDLPAGPAVLASDERGGAITVLDPVSGAVVGSITTGRRPRGLALSPDRSRLYVALTAGPEDSASEGIGVVDLASGKLKTVLDTGPNPEVFALSPDGGALFVSSEDTGEVVRFDFKSNQVTARFKVGAEPEGAAPTPDGKRLVVACEAADAVYVIDLASGQGAQIAVPGRPRGVAVTRDGALAYVTAENAGQVAVIDLSTLKTVASIALPDADPKAGAASQTAPKPMGLALSPDQTRLYVATGRGRGVAEIDLASNTVTRLLGPVGARPWGVTVSNDGKTLFTADGPSDTVSRIDLASGAVTALPAGASPWGVVFGLKPGRLSARTG